MSTVITHFYNEEYLLKFWLRHHVERFNHGILLNYSSTDNSLDVVRQMAPHWKVIDIFDKYFDAEKLEEYIFAQDVQLTGPRISLTVAEFFIGDLSVATTKDLIVPSVELLALPEQGEFDGNLDFHSQVPWGIHYISNWSGRAKRGRLLTNRPFRHEPGRHFPVQGGAESCLIYRVGSCLVSEAMVNRRLQIQDRISNEEIEKGFGSQHTDNGKGLTRESLIASVERDFSFASDLSSLISCAIERELFKLYEPDFKYSRELVIQLIKQRDFQLERADNLELNSIREKKGISSLCGAGELAFQVWRAMISRFFRSFSAVKSTARRGLVTRAKSVDDNSTKK